jgi:hypothetical protein
MPCRGHASSHWPHDEHAHGRNARLDHALNTNEGDAFIGSVALQLYPRFLSTERLQEKDFPYMISNFSLAIVPAKAFSSMIMKKSAFRGRKQMKNGK